MPIFEYICKECRNTFELLVRSGEQVVTCPGCKSDQISKLFSTFAYRGDSSTHNNSSSGCGSCSGGNCSTCH